MSAIVQLFSGTYGSMHCNSVVKACLSVSMTSTESNVTNQVFLWQQQREVGGSSYNEEFQVGDHDFTQFSIIPSVMFRVESYIPDTIEGSWYSGQVCITFKKGEFQPSSPMRHGAELSSWLTTQLGSKSILFLYTDGRPDHLLTYVSTQLSLISLCSSICCS